MENLGREEGGGFIKGTIFTAGPSHGPAVKMIFTVGPIVVGLSGV